MSNTLHILVTNDDGTFSPGILELVDALSKIAKITVIAPDKNCSGISSAITLETPLRVMETPMRVMKTPMGWYQLNGTPADCVKLGLSGFLTDVPDMVISGINAGANLGDDVVYSGTVGGAIEGRFLPKYPAIAISSIGHHGRMHYNTAAKVAVDLIESLLEKPLKSGLVLNVNVPNVRYEKLKGIQLTRQGDRHMCEPLMSTEDGRGRRIYWLGEAGKASDGGEGTDFHAVHEGYVSVTPLQVDLTAHQAMNTVQGWMEACGM